MDDQPRPEDIPPRPDPSQTIADDPDPVRREQMARRSDSGPDASEAPEEKGSASR